MLCHLKCFECIVFGLCVLTCADFVLDTSSDAPLDLKIKASMISDMFSLVGEFFVCIIFYSLLIRSPLYYTPHPSYLLVFQCQQTYEHAQ